MIDVSELITDPDFAQTFTVTRSTGEWDEGDFITTVETFSVTGVIQPMNSKEMEQWPEGDRLKGLCKVYTLEQLYTTQVVATEGMLSDEVSWHGVKWKILQSNDWMDNGYFKAVAVRKTGA